MGDHNELKCWGTISFGVQRVVGKNAGFCQPFARKLKKAYMIVAISIILKVAITRFGDGNTDRGCL